MVIKGGKGGIKGGKGTKLREEKVVLRESYSFAPSKIYGVDGLNSQYPRY